MTPESRVIPLVLQTLYRSGSFRLLASLVLLLCVSSLLDQTSAYGAILSMAFAFVLVFAVRVMTTDKRQRIIVYSCAVLWLVIDVAKVVSKNQVLDFASDVPFVAFCFFCAGTMLHRIVTAKEVDFEVVCGSISAYLLIATTWAVSYDLIYAVNPDAFRIPENIADPNINHFIYFSLTTITTLGYGDITPASTPLGIWATLEAVVGVFYMAVLVARLVSMYRG